MSLRTNRQKRGIEGRGENSPIKLFICLIITMLVTETAVTVLIHQFPAHVPVPVEVVVQVVLLLGIIFPVLYKLVLSPLLHQITERSLAVEALRESEARYRELVHSLDGIVWECDPHSFAFTFVSSQAVRILGYPAQLWLASPTFWAEHIHPEDRPWAVDFWVAATRKGEDHEFEYRMLAADGRTVWLRDMVTVICEDGRCIALRGVMVDITRHKHAESQLQFSLREKDALLREVHHRVGNNLQIITSLLGLQAGYFTDSYHVALFNDSRNRIATLALIYESLSNSASLNEIDFTRYVKTLLCHLQDTHGIDSSAVSCAVTATDIVLDIDTAIPCGLIINELATNAFKFAFPDGMKGHVGIGLEAHEGGRIILSVRDDGVGFPPDVDLSQTSSLGLRLVNLLVEQIGGVMECTTTRGTEFRISFGRNNGLESI